MVFAGMFSALNKTPSNTFPIATKSYDFRTAAVNSNNVTFTSGETGILSGSNSLDSTNGLNGTNSSIELTYFPRFTDKIFSFEILFTYNSLLTWGSLFDFANGLGNNRNNITLMMNNDSPNKRLNFIFCQADTAAQSHNKIDFIFTEETEYHLVIIFDKNNNSNGGLTCYIDNSMVNFEPPSYPSTWTTLYNNNLSYFDLTYERTERKVGISNWNAQSGAYIKYLNYYDRVLTASEVTRLYNNRYK